MRKPPICAPTRSDTNLPVQSQKQARSLKFWVKVEEILYYLCSEQKGADQLRSDCEADLRLCFSPMQSLFSHAATQIETSNKRVCQLRVVCSRV